MLPYGELSTKAVVSPSADPAKRPGDFLVDYERGGIALNDPSQGQRVQIWRLEVERNNSNVSQWDFYVSAPTVPRTLLLSANDVTEAALAFDQNMRPFIAYVAAGVTRIWWYDPGVPGQVTTVLGTGYKSPRCTTDEKRSWHTSISDIELFYIRNGNLYERRQRDRFLVEKFHKTVGPNAELVSLTMGTGNRLVIRIRNSNVSANDPQAVLQTDPYLSDIIMDMCVRAGIAAEDVDVNDLYGENVVGYLVSSDEGVNESMKPLAEAFFFDPTEYDRKLRFFRRGRDASFTFNYGDLVAGKGSKPPMNQKRMDETKLPLRVDVNHVDPDGGFAKNKQSAYRKSNLVNAKGNKTLEFDFAMYADQAASVALKYIKMKWHEPLDWEWALPLAFTRVMPADVGIYTDEDGSMYRIRVEERNEADGVINFKGKLDGGNAVYGSKASGNALQEPISTTPGLVGETRLELLNIPPMRDQDDELGIYIAMGGNSAAWYGATLQISTDNGINYVEAARTEVPATMGDLESELAATVNAEYPSEQSFIVKTNFELESVARETLLTNYNRAVVGDEIIQFQNALHLGDNRYLLSGLIRGRYDTDVQTWPAGTRFVLIDTALMFVQAQQWMLNKELLFKPISFGEQDEDDAVPTAYDFDVAHSQLEWTPYNVVNTRIDTTVTTSWIGRGRLGIETAPTNGKYFIGYRVKYSDGVTTDTTATVLARTGVPAGTTVQVCGLNSITGEGPYTTPIGT